MEFGQKILTVVFIVIVLYILIYYLKLLHFLRKFVANVLYCAIQFSTIVCWYIFATTHFQYLCDEYSSKLTFDIDGLELDKMIQTANNHMELISDVLILCGFSLIGIIWTYRTLRLHAILKCIPCTDKINKVLTSYLLIFGAALMVIIGMYLQWYIMSNNQHRYQMQHLMIYPKIKQQLTSFATLPTQEKIDSVKIFTLNMVDNTNHVLRDVKQLYHQIIKNEL